MPDAEGARLGYEPAAADGAPWASVLVEELVGVGCGVGELQRYKRAPVLPVTVKRRSGSALAAFADAGAVGAGLASGDLFGVFLPFGRFRDFLPSPYDRQGAAGLVEEIKPLGRGFGFVQGFVAERNHEPFLPGFDLPAVGLFGDAVDFLAGLGEGDGRAPPPCGVFRANLSIAAFPFPYSAQGSCLPFPGVRGAFSALSGVRTGKTPVRAV